MKSIQRRKENPETEKGHSLGNECKTGEIFTIHGFEIMRTQTFLQSLERFGILESPTLNFNCKSTKSNKGVINILLCRPPCVFQIHKVMGTQSRWVPIGGYSR